MCAIYSDGQPISEIEGRTSTIIQNEISENKDRKWWQFWKPKYIVKQIERTLVTPGMTYSELKLYNHFHEAIETGHKRALEKARG